MHDGVCETPPLHADLAGLNVALRHWHPTSVRTRDAELRGRADTGGAWEWTATVLAPLPGFAPMPEYPEYTADFFDGKHNIVLGASWATHPRIAGRRTL